MSEMMKMLQNMDFVAGLKCKKCKRFIPFEDEYDIKHHRDGSISIRTNAFHSVVCECEGQSVPDTASLINQNEVK